MARHALLVLAAGCVDEPVAIAPIGGGPPADRLSQLGLFADPVAQVPAAGVVPYDIIAPLWSDGAAKRRFVYAPVPIATTDDAWRVPAGTYLVKTFLAGERLVETRVIAFSGDGVATATYVWNDAQTDAIASGGNLDLAVGDHVHHVPGTSQCNACHDGGALGLRTPQLAGEAAALFAAGVIDRVPDGGVPFVDPYGDGPLEDRAASYLDVNCAHCHPGGEAQGTHADWRREHLHDNLCRRARVQLDGRTRVIDPGHPEASVAIARLRAADPFVHMPRGPSHVLDERGIAVVEAWIASLPEGCP